jgi:AsmA protein
MQTVLKLFAGFLSVLLILVASAAILLSTMVNSDWLKNQISQYVKSTTGRDLIIKGTLHASFWPRLGVTVDDVSLSNPAGFSGENFLFAHKLTISAELMPLLHRQLTVNRATLNDAVINLQKNSQGQTNWSFKPSQKKSSLANQTTATHNTEKSMQFDIAALALAHTTIHYSDAQTRQNLSLENVNITADNLSSDQPFPLRGDFTYITEQKSKTAIKLDSLALYDSTTALITLNNIDLRLKPTNFPAIAIKGDIKANLNTSAIKISPLTLEMANLRFTGELSGSHLRDNPQLSGHVSTNTFNLSKLLASTAKPLHLKNKNSLTHVQLNADLQMSAQKISLNTVDANVDGQKLRGHLDYTLSPISHLSFALNSNQLILEDYLSSSASSESEHDKKAAGENRSGSLVVDGAISLQGLSYDVYRFSRVKTTLKYAANRLDLQSFSAGIFGGSTAGAISINWNGNATAFSLQQRMSGIRVEEMLRTLTGTSKLTGNASLNINVNGSGNSGDTIKRTLSGTASFNVSNGIIAGTDIDYKIDQAISKYTQRAARVSDRGHSPFTHLSGSAHFSNGTSTNPDLELLTPALRIQAEGTHNLLSDKINYQLTCRLLQPQEINAEYLGTKINADLANYDIPAKIGCTLANPCVNVDMVGVMKILAVEGVKAVAKTAMKKELLKHVDPNLGNVLDNLFTPRTPQNDEPQE